MTISPLTFLHSRPKLLTPGPTPVPQEIRNICLRDPIYHRGPEYAEMFMQCRSNLAELFQTKSLPLILTSSGTGALEAAVVNFTEVGDEVLIVKGGKFGERWQKLAETYECKAHVLDVPSGYAVTPDQVAQKLKDHPNTKCLFIQASETSTGVYHPLEEVCKESRKINPDLVIVVDAVSAICAHDIKMDAWTIDIMASGSQKGFGVPPGLAFIAVNDRAWTRKSNRAKFYFDLTRELKGQNEGLSAWTSATTIVEQLHFALKALCEMGPTKLARHHKRLSDAVRQSFVENGIELFAKVSPSHALTSFIPPYGLSAKDLSKRLKEAYGFQIAGGQSELKGVILRLAHLGFVNDFTLLESLNAVEFALKDLHHAHRLGSITSIAMSHLYASMDEK